MTTNNGEKIDNISKGVANLLEIQAKAQRPLFRNLMKLQEEAMRLGFKVTAVDLMLDNKSYGYEELEIIEDRLLGINLN